MNDFGKESKQTNYTGKDIDMVYNLSKNNDKPNVHANGADFSTEPHSNNFVLNETLPENKFESQESEVNTPVADNLNYDETPKNSTNTQGSELKRTPIFSITPEVSFKDSSKFSRETENMKVISNEKILESLPPDLVKQTINQNIGGPFYTVQPADSLWSISIKFLGNPEKYKDIMELNNLKSTTIYPGQILKIPNDDNISATQYKVKHGDTLWNIAQRFLGYGPRYDEIMRANNLSNDVIHPNQILIIPSISSNESSSSVRSNTSIRSNYNQRYPQTKRYYIVRPGDTLWKIAQNMLGSGNRYVEIVRLNGLRGQNIKVGQRLLLPK